MWSSVLRISPVNTRSVASKQAPRRLDAVSSGPNTRKLRASALSFMTSRRKAPMVRVASAVTAPGVGTATA